MRNAEKKLSILSLCLALALLFSIGAAAAGDDTLLITMTDTLNADGSHTVQLDLSEDTGVEMMQFVLNYDAAALELTACSPGALFNSAPAPTVARREGSVSFVWDALEPLGGGSLLTLTFTPKEGAAGTTELKHDPNEDTVFANGNYENIPYAISSLTIDLTPATAAPATEPAEEKPETAVPAPPPVPETVTEGGSNGIPIAFTDAELNPGETVTVPIGENEGVVWSSGDENVATVDENGTVTAVGAGKTIITVESEDGTRSASCIVTVSDPLKAQSASAVSQTSQTFTAAEAAEKNNAPAIAAAIVLAGAAAVTAVALMIAKKRKSASAHSKR